MHQFRRKLFSLLRAEVFTGLSQLAHRLFPLELPCQNSTN
jgi:hypothetical protein